MNTQFHTPSFGDEVFDLGETTSTSTPISSMASGNMMTNNNSFMYQQQTPQTKRMISLHNTSDEYHTANEESFTTANTNLMNTPNNGQPQQQPQQQQQGVTNPNANMTTPTTTMAARKQMLPLGLNEPAKPLSAYALFFRDTVSAIKQQNPSCSFQELSKIVASMWDALDPGHKIVYNKKNELARNEYLNQMKVYRQHLEQQQQQQQQQAAQEQIIEQNSNTINSNTDTNTPITSTPQQLTTPPAATNSNNPQNTQSSANTNTDSSSSNVTSATGPPSDEQMRLLTEAGSVQKCTRERCTKRAIINPDWEDEYCSNECVVIHCRNVFNEWVQSNLEAKQQPQQQQQPTST